MEGGVALLLGGSVPFNCCMWLLALCLFITIVKAPSQPWPASPASSKPSQNLCERPGQGSGVP